MNRLVLFRSSVVICTVFINQSFSASVPLAAHQPKNTQVSEFLFRLEKIFANTRPVCFGRFVIEVPATAVVVFGRMTVDFEVDHFPGEAEMADINIAKHAAKFGEEKYLTKKIHSGSLNGKILKDGIPGQRTFIRKNYDSYNINSYFPIQDDLFLFKINGVRTEDQVNHEIAEIDAIAYRVRARADDEIPVESGVCLEGGFINVNPTFENIEIGIRLAEYPDVHLSISTMKNRGEPAEYEKLEIRLQRAEREAIEEGNGDLYKRIKFIRRAPRQMGDWVGEEALARMPAEKGKFASHKFQFYAMGADNDVFRPVADVQLDTGVVGNATKAKPPSVSDDEAVAIWDRLTSSIRARPTAPLATAKK